MYIAQEKLNVLLSTEDMDVIRTYILNTSNKIRACYYSKIHWSTFDKAMLGGPVKLYQRHKLLEYCRMVKEKGEEQLNNQVPISNNQTMNNI